MPLFFSLLLACAASLAAAPLKTDPDWRGPWKGLPQLLAILETVPEGQAILEKAKKKDPLFLDRIRSGDASYTESTFARTYSLLDGQEKIELKHDVTISKHLPLGEAVVDFAHELVHFTEKAMLDPYKPGFELEEFVRRGIEGQGGELQALRQECLVAWSLKRQYRKYPEHRLCEPYQGKKGEFLNQKALGDYYALGSWKKRASPKLLKAIPELTTEDVVFTSSYAKKPYPIALTEEFDATRETACVNNRKKYHLISAQAESGRAPAGDLLQKESRRLKAYDRLYCHQPAKK